MASETYECDICAGIESSSPKLVCCGQKYCLGCMLRTSGLCHVCKKDELNEPLQCDICGDVGNSFTVSVCGECDMFVCGECDKAAPTTDGSPGLLRYCSWRHFSEMMDKLFE
jgi:hypothetical protein